MAPAGLPGSWQPVSSGLAVGGANGAGTVTWQLGYLTPDGALASLEETNASAASFIRRMTNSGHDARAGAPGRAGLEPGVDTVPGPALAVRTPPRRAGRSW